MLRTVAFTLLQFAGAALFAFGIGVDFLLPGTSPGLNLPQFLLIAAGALLFLGAWRARRGLSRRGMGGRRLHRVAAVPLIALLTLIALEVVLTLWGIATYYPADVQLPEMRLISWQLCDEAGCRLNYDGIQLMCAAGDFEGRHCKINRQGFGDDEDFVASQNHSDRARLIMLGDSFTQGYSADVGKSYVETLEAVLPEAIIWNLGITTTGTNRHLEIFQTYGPMLKPQLTVLGFYMNDFTDNVLGRRISLQLRDDAGNLTWLRFELVNRWGTTVNRPSELIYAYGQHNVLPPESELERLIGLTRLGSLLFRVIDQASPVFADQSWQRQQQQTRIYLEQLRDAVDATGSDFLVMLIPRREDFGAPSEQYAAAITMMKALSIPYISLVELLDATADYAPEPDLHWNNTGHQKVGALLADCVESVLAGGALADCEHVITR